MTQTATSTCSWQRCTRKTRDRSGRCFQHKGSRVLPPERKVISLPSPEPGIRCSSELRRDGSVSETTYKRQDYLHREDGPARILYGVGGEVQREEWYRGGLMHREDGPASVGYYPDGTVKSEGWWLEDQAHRVGAPASISYFPDGSVSTMYYYLEGQIGRPEDEPSGIAFHENGQREREQFHLNGMLGRTKGPAMTRWNEDGVAFYEAYHTAGDGRMHRIDGPAVIHRNAEGVFSESYRIRGRLHRIDGPAEIIYGADGSAKVEKYYFDGIEFTPRYEFHAHLGRMQPVLLRRAFEESPYGVLIAEGFEPNAMLEVQRDGVWSVEGMRAVLSGAPVEWAKSFEEGAS